MTQTEEHFDYQEAYRKKPNASACTNCKDDCKIAEIVNGEKLCPHFRVFEKHPFDTESR